MFLIIKRKYDIAPWSVQNIRPEQNHPGCHCFLVTVDAAALEWHFYSKIEHRLQTKNEDNFFAFILRRAYASSRGKYFQLSIFEMLDIC